MTKSHAPTSDRKPRLGAASRPVPAADRKKTFLSTCQSRVSLHQTLANAPHSHSNAVDQTLHRGIAVPDLALDENRRVLLAWVSRGHTEQQPGPHEAAGPRAWPGSGSGRGRVSLPGLRGGAGGGIIVNLQLCTYQRERCRPCSQTTGQKIWAVLGAMEALSTETFRQPGLGHPTLPCSTPRSMLTLAPRTFLLGWFHIASQPPLPPSGPPSPSPSWHFRHRHHQHVFLSWTACFCLFPFTSRRRAQVELSRTIRILPNLPDGAAP